LIVGIVYRKIHMSITAHAGGHYMLRM